MVLGTMFVVASLHVDRASFPAPISSRCWFSPPSLGLATVGQTLVALLGGLDLSIPFLIGSSNVGLLYLIGLGIPSPIAVILILVIGAAIGFLNGLLSFPSAGAGVDRDAWRWLRDLRPHPDPDEHRVGLCRQCVRTGA